jgi:hypothetical protein
LSQQRELEREGLLKKDGRREKVLVITGRRGAHHNSENLEERACWKKMDDGRGKRGLVIMTTGTGKGGRIIDRQLGEGGLVVTTRTGKRGLVEKRWTTRKGACGTTRNQRQLTHLD